MFSGCTDKLQDETKNATIESSTELQNNSIIESEKTTANHMNEESNIINTTKNQIEKTSTETTIEETTLSALDRLEKSEAVTYYSDNPNNKYICAVADKYGVDKTCLVALIRTKAQNPGATVLQFSGKTDENGNLIMSKNELISVYEINDADRTIKRASEKSSENDGYTSSESRTIFRLTKQFIVPELENLKEERVYPE